MTCKVVREKTKQNVNRQDSFYQRTTFFFLMLTGTIIRKYVNNLKQLKIVNVLHK